MTYHARPIPQRARKLSWRAQLTFFPSSKVELVQRSPRRDMIWPHLTLMHNQFCAVSRAILSQGWALNEPLVKPIIKRKNNKTLFTTLWKICITCSSLMSPAHNERTFEPRFQPYAPFRSGRGCQHVRSEVTRPAMENNSIKSIICN